MSNAPVLLRVVSHPYTNHPITHKSLSCLYLAPNPINGCLCEVINSCSCVASHLQEVRDDQSTDGSVYSQSPSVIETFSSGAPISSCHAMANNNTNHVEQSAPPLPDQQQPLNTSPLIDDADLMNFLENDLDKYLTTTSTSDVFVSSANIPGIH